MVGGYMEDLKKPTKLEGGHIHYNVTQSTPSPLNITMTLFWDKIVCIIVSKGFLVVGGLPIRRNSSKIVIMAKGCLSP